MYVVMLYVNRKKSKGKTDVKEHDNSITKFLQQEKDEAQKCKETHNDEKCKPKAQPTAEDSVARNLDPVPDSPHADSDAVNPNDNASDSEEDDEDELSEDEVEEKSAEEVKETVGEGEETAKKEEGTTTPLDVCNTVEQALTPENLTQACGLKYGPGGKENFPNWKCIPTGNTSNEGAATGGEPTSGGSEKGSICVPPRRRKLYVGGLTKWAKKQVTPQESNEATEASVSSQVGEASPAPTAATASPSPKGDSLLTAFVESAAIETFFLWDRYKKTKGETTRRIGRCNTTTTNL